jgi:hypothetical protein
MGGTHGCTTGVLRVQSKVLVILLCEKTWSSLCYLAPTDITLTPSVTFSYPYAPNPADTEEDSMAEAQSHIDATSRSCSIPVTWPTICSTGEQFRVMLWYPC